ncbi:transmembrane protein 45A [Cajanus cajan]|uniref:Transmembrane protein 45B n=1 Tax=Cajanus cajan TaxID=3821 RepID=A0A151U0K4_CAJCA|nr:transmembrane protein 45A [Cajanus cajan]KYP72820.1 Transmembrane protein 45B [Cajanus cajan]
MGTLVGHVAPGLAFLLIGLWHLFNHTKLHALNPTSYTAQPWFPTPKLRHLELLLIMAASTASISMELFIGPDRHQPFDPDATIPSNHLHNFEHASISLAFLLYAASALLLDHFRPPSKQALTQLLAAVAFAQQLLLFHLHSADHTGPEGQYHSLLQLLVFISLSTTLLGIPITHSFLLSFLRSLAILFQGIWLFVMGLMLWTPGLVPKGCFINQEEGHQVVRCSDHASLHRALSLVNILFSWFVIGVTAFGVAFYLAFVKFYGQQKPPYFALDTVDKLSDDVESQKRSVAANPKSFIHVATNFSPLDIER